MEVKLATCILFYMYAPMLCDHCRTPGGCDPPFLKHLFGNTIPIFFNTDTRHDKNGLGSSNEKSLSRPFNNIFFPRQSSSEDDSDSKLSGPKSENSLFDRIDFPSPFRRQTDSEHDADDSGPKRRPFNRVTSKPPPVTQDSSDRKPPKIKPQDRGFNHFTFPPLFTFEDKLHPDIVSIDKTQGEQVVHDAEIRLHNEEEKVMSSSNQKQTDTERLQELNAKRQEVNQQTIKEDHEAQKQTKVVQELQEHGVTTDPDGRLVQPDVDELDDVKLRIPDCKLPEVQSCARVDNAVRSHSGHCNNLAKPNLGKARTAFSRRLQARYQDDLWEPVTVAADGGILPSPRLVSASVVTTARPRQRPEGSGTLSVMLFGQLINHDMISTMEHEAGSRPGGLRCCNSGRPSTTRIEACLPITIASDDDFYSRFGQTCMNQIRSAPAVSEDCLVGPVHQLNQVSQFLDASVIYGSHSQAARRIRTLQDGHLKTSGENLLFRDGGKFISGEIRLTENTGLTFMHTVWTREHNRVAEELKSHHEEWTDERLYHQARRIVIAEYQHIVYNELLPVILGSDFTSKRGLDPISSNRYSDQIDPRINNEFSTAAFRFGHAQIPDAYHLGNTRVAMEKTFFESELFRKQNFMVDMARGLINQPSEPVGTTFSASVHQRLFSGGGANQPGLDLVALNINRGRDHGLPGYITVLENCLGRQVRDWAALERIIDRVSLRRLQNVYTSVEDIDLYIGSMSEKTVPGSLVGPTFQCIIGDQFFNTRYGDRFFYDNRGQPGSLTTSQISEVRETSWARILCDNIPGMGSVQPRAFRHSESTSNPAEDCDSAAIPTLNLNVF